MADDTRHETERIYDEQMAPLVTELIRIAKEHDLPMVLSVGMVMQDGEPGACSTLIPSGRPRLAGASNRCRLAAGVMYAHKDMDRAAALVISRFHDEVPDAR